MQDEKSRFYQTKPEGVTVRGVVLTLCVSFGIFAVSIGASRFFFPPSTALNTRLSPGELNEVDGPSGPTEVQESTGYTTSQCAGKVDLPVMSGADLVAYHSLEDDEDAVFGDASISAEFNGYLFYFASEENRELFEEKPWYYLPAWGGFCSWGIAMEWWWKKGTLGPDADPNSWFITDDEVLHFFRSETPKSKFLANIDVNVRKGNDVWKSWYDGEPTAAHDGAPLNTACFCDVSSCEDN